MKINLKNGESTSFTKDFPMNILEIQDTLDRLGQDSSAVNFRISEYENMYLPKSICRDFSADIYRLNLFVNRYEGLGYAEKAVFKSLVERNPACEIDDMILMTYGLESVPVWQCDDIDELGETVITGRMIDEISDFDDEKLEILSRTMVGAVYQERNGGAIIDGYYCELSAYEKPEINIEFGRPENCFFRLLIATVKKNGVPDYSSAQWISLPLDEENQNINLKKMTCVKSESSLPNLLENQFQTKNIGELNELAKSLSELSYDDFVKLKAVMERENIHDIAETLDFIGRLSEYQFDRNIADSGEFGKAYLLKNLPADFDSAILENTDLCDFGEKILAQKNGVITSYGAVSGRGQELYSTLTVQPEQEFDEDENCGMGMSL
ncbi:MAG: hypothetical protein NC485_10065 [Ruminococcus flavefaciens]|nr:hypothetical protein [Ruminococcus flavefaciens]MCM1062190.1 hypothetical protein [Eubacterium sp.]